MNNGEKQTQNERKHKLIRSSVNHKNKMKQKQKKSKHYIIKIIITKIKETTFESSWRKEAHIQIHTHATSHYSQWRIVKKSSDSPQKQ